MGYPILRKCVEVDFSPGKVKSYTLTKEELKAYNKSLESSSHSHLDIRDNTPKANITKSRLAAELREGTAIEDISKLYNLKRSTIVTYIKRWNLQELNNNLE